MIDKLFFVVLVLNATGLFRFVAAGVGVSIGRVSLALLIFNIFYLVCRLPRLVPMLAKMLPWFVMLLAWPLATVAYAPAIEMREIALAIYGFTLFAAAAVYTVTNGLSAIGRVFLASLALTVFGQVLNMALPGYFETVAKLADARVLALGRPGGFFMQPNELAMAMVLLFIGWLALAKRDTVFREPFIILVFLTCGLLTGSRAGIILGVLVVGLHLAYQWRGRVFRPRKTRFFSKRLAILVACVFFGVIGAKVFIETYGDKIGHQPGSLIKRVGRLLDFKLGDDKELMKDTSLQERFAAQRAYWKLIKEKPLLGHGFGSEMFYLRRGDLHVSAHSTTLSVALEFGIVYPAVFLLLLAGLFLSRYRRQVARAMGTNTVMQFAVVTLLMFVGLGRLFDRRVFFVLLGMVYATVNYPQRVFLWDKLTRTYTGILSKGEIRQARRKQKRHSKPSLADSSKTEAK